MFQTLQDRLVKELALAGIATVDARQQSSSARFMSRVTMPCCAVRAEQDGSAFVAIPEVDLNEVLCIQEDRQVGNDNTVTFHRHRLQIPPVARCVRILSQAQVRVRQYHDGTRQCDLPRAALSWPL